MTVERLKYTHEAVIDYIIANPGVRQVEIAAKFGYSPNWVSLLMSSDAFKAKLRERRAEIVNPLLIERVEEGFEAIVRAGQRIVLEKLDASPSPDFALRAMEAAAKAAGYGPKPVAGAQVNQQFIVQVPPQAASAAEWAQTYGPAGATGPGAAGTRPAHPSMAPPAPPLVLVKGAPPHELQAQEAAAAPPLTPVAP